MVSLVHHVSFFITSWLFRYKLKTEMRLKFNRTGIGGGHWKDCQRKREWLIEGEFHLGGHSVCLDKCLTHLPCLSVLLLQVFFFLSLFPKQDNCVRHIPNLRWQFRMKKLCRFKKKCKSWGRIFVEKYLNYILNNWNWLIYIL